MFVLATGTLYKYGLNRIFQIAKELEFDGIELFMNNNVYDTTDKEYLKNLVDTYNIPIVGLKIPNDVNTPAKVRDAISFAEDLNIPVVILRVPRFTDFKFTNWFKKYLPKLQDKTNVKIAIENAPSGTGFILPEYSIGAMNEMKRFSYICLDTSHLVTRKADLIRTYESMKKHIAFIHLSNWHKNNEHWMLHEGILPIESFLSKLATDGYQGPISLKLDLEVIGKDKINLVIKNVKQAKDFYTKYFTSKRSN